MEKDIDFVVPWVDGNDDVWKKEKEKYSMQDKKVDDAEVRYRDWENLKYWFRSVEKYAPWVRRIHFITYGHLPDFLNTCHPKIHIVRHEDYIPEKYLPTFSANVIELNMHRIPELSEQFVYFNDDMFLNKRAKKRDFFRNGKPCYEALETLLLTDEIEEIFNHILLNNIAIINKNYDKREVFRKNINKWINLKYGKDIVRNILLMPWSRYQSMVYRHGPIPLLKSTIEDVWKAEPKVLDLTSSNRIRNIVDVNQYLFWWWDIARGNFCPYHRNKDKVYFLQNADLEEVKRDILRSKSKSVCINDSKNIVDFEVTKELMKKTFQEKYPEKSSYEL